MHTIDRLIDPRVREIVTTFDTGIRENEQTYNAGTVRVALSTTHDKARKRFETRINRELVTDTGFTTRSFVLFAAPTADSGIILATEPTARFNAAKARALHEWVLAHLDTLLARENRHPGVARELEGLLATAVAA